MRIGIIGGGQLGRMLALGGYPLGATFTVLEPNSPCPAGQLAEHIAAPYDDKESLGWLIARSDVITYEFENIPADTARLIAEHALLYPPPAALMNSQDRLYEKHFFRGIGAQTPVFEPVHSRAQLDTALKIVGTPAVLKTRTLGYDGKGQWRIASAEHLTTLDIPESAFGAGLILEAHVPFDRELSILAVRGSTGETAFYPLTENTHREGILRTSRAPAVNAPQAEAERIAAAALDALDYVGVLAIELFETNGVLLVNEMAPRVHNSGHWTIEGAQTSQFENHIRALVGLPLGSTAARGHAAMVNLIGTEPPLDKLAEIPGLHIHRYGKEPRPGRKLGHVTLVTETAEEREEGLARVEELQKGS
jgi:5-(carboxyamino)imidazole ribonucleotide synthase